MSRLVLSVGIEIPGNGAESVEILSDRSLLDADLVIFHPDIPHFYGSSTYQGKRCLNDDDSFRLKEAVAHWKRELSAAIEAGKAVVLLLAAPETIYVATGTKEYSGTGKNARTTRHVEPISSYSMVPLAWQFSPASGSGMVLAPAGKFLREYWNVFERLSEYRLYLDGEIKGPTIKTKSGDRVVGAIVRKGKGALVALPSIDFDDDTLTEQRKVDGKVSSYWTDNALALGNAFVSTLVRISDELSAESARTPIPEWVRNDEFRLAAEAVLEASISRLSEEVIRIEEQQRQLKQELAESGELRRLLFEQGFELEDAVRQALRLMGFEAAQLKDGDSEFDVVFESSEGRFIGEAEGKDTRAINIDKFSQLERNLNEDFARENVTSFAKGVLFGNAFRLKPVSERAAPFTEKCFSAALRLKAALVSTPDLFEPTRYILESGDLKYAADCRRAIFDAEGTLVIFPKPKGLRSDEPINSLEKV